MVANQCAQNQSENLSICFFLNCQFEEFHCFFLLLVKALNRNSIQGPILRKNYINVSLTHVSFLTELPHVPSVIFQSPSLRLQNVCVT